MAEHSKDLDDTYIQGFSVVDSLSTSSVSGGNSTVKYEESVAEAAVDNDGTSEEKFVCKREEADDEVGVLVLDDRDTKDVKDIEYKEPNQSTLIITTEDILDSTAFEDTKDLEVKEERKSPEVPEQKKKAKPKRDDHNYFWVSNISRQVKAADLKKFFSQLGKVLTAKILTNGKNYFGYVSMNSNELATKCIKQFNNTSFDGKKILVSKDRPDLKEVKPSVKVEPKKKKEPKKVESPVEEKPTKPNPVESKEKRTDDTKSSGVIADLKKKLERAKTDVNRYKWKVMEFQRRHEGMRKKCDTLERELKDAQYKLRDERRKLNQDREQFEKNKKLEQIRFDADRAIINKELDEVKKLREHLKEKIEEFKVQTKKAPKRRSRSPIVHRRRSPPLRTNTNNVFRPEDKKRKREDLSRGRTPPPPPKLSEVVSKKRERENNAPNRGYFGDVAKMHEYDYRHAKSSYAPTQDELRGSWLTPFPKDPRRVGAGPSSSNNFPEMRYGGGYQFPSSGLSGPPRSYYPEFGKNYGPY